MDIRGKNALVTGASRGLGAALARRLASRGARVIAVARGQVELEAVTNEIALSGGVAHALVADVGDKSATLRIAGAAAALVGPIDLLIHDASTLGPTPMPALLDTECEELARVLEVNLVGPFRLSKALVGPMLLRGSGLVVHVSSDAAVEAYPRWGAYGVSKAAFDHLARIWAAELAGSGVAVWSIDPGEMDTAMHRAAMPEADPSTLADPTAVAASLVWAIEHHDRFASGTRLLASQLGAVAAREGAQVAQVSA